MGLFSFGKKKQKMSTNGPEQFYTDCVETYHSALKAKGYANHGLIFIPELIPVGKKAVMAYLQDPFFRMEMGDNVAQYYYFICLLSYMTGVVYADKWHTDYNGLKTGFADQIIEEGPSDYAQPLLQAELGLTAEKQAEELFATVFKKWLEMHEPYWALSDARDYTFNAMMAAYQAGISTLLEKYGY